MKYVKKFKDGLYTVYDALDGSEQVYTGKELRKQQGIFGVSDGAVTVYESLQACLEAAKVDGFFRGEWLPFKLSVEVLEESEHRPELIRCSDRDCGVSFREFVKRTVEDNQGVFRFPQYIGSFTPSGAFTDDLPKDLSVWDMQSVRTGSPTYKFAGHKKLVEMHLPYAPYVPPEVCKGCTALRTASVRFISDRDVDSFSMLIGSDAFNGCRALQDMQIGYGCTDILGSAFEDCVSLKVIKLPETVQFIRDAAFKGSGLQKFTAPKDLRCISRYAFADCKDLSTVTLNEGLTHIGEKAFYGCNSLKVVRVPDTLESICKNSFPSTTILETHNKHKTVTALMMAGLFKQMRIVRE